MGMRAGGWVAGSRSPGAPRAPASSPGDHGAAARSSARADLPCPGRIPTLCTAHPSPQARPAGLAAELETFPVQLRVKPAVAGLPAREAGGGPGRVGAAGCVIPTLCPQAPKSLEQDV